MTEWIENFFSKHCVNLATDQLIATTKAIYNNTEVQVKVNGNMSKSFLIEKGVRQGCSLLIYHIYIIYFPLYIILAEVMIENIGQNKQIKGITVLQNEIKISAFADDTTFYLGNNSSFLHLQNELQDFELFAGVKYNRASALVCG